MATIPAAAPSLDLTACDREPIHVPGSIQPHGLLLIADAATLQVVAGAGALEAAFGEGWLGAGLGELLVQDVAALVAPTAPGPGGTVIGEPVAIAGVTHDLAIHRSGDHLLIELEPAAAQGSSAAASLAWIDVTAAQLERAGDLPALCERAATAFRALTGFDRVMIYRFLDSDAGRVIGEDRDPALSTFMHHHFPATDIPQQARALYVRNRTRVIPDVNYAPAPIRPADFAAIDLSDVAVRSVSPIHVQYLRNMEVAASASISIVKDGVLWGLVACHHHAPKLLTRDVRAMAGALAGTLARQVRARDEAVGYRERLRLRADADAVLARIAVDKPLAKAIAGASQELRAMLDGDGLAFVEGSRVTCWGHCPPEPEVEDIARWVEQRGAIEPFATHHLAALRPGAEALRAHASGLLAMPLVDGGAMLLWFRAEQVEEVEWAGNPHKAVPHDPDVPLTPRASFETWTEAVRGRSRRWSLEEVGAAHRLRAAIHELAVARQLRELNRQLDAANTAKDGLLAQKDLLMREVDHRVQNSLQLVAAFLSLQAKEAGPGEVADTLAEARARLSAVAHVHRRLYRDDQIETIDLARYLDDLAGDMKTSLGDAWARQIRLDLAPVLVPTDRAVNVGLVMTELVINATKYAYAGAPGPINIALEQHRNRLRLIVADEGRGVAGGAPTTSGFGSRMMTAVVARLEGTLEITDNTPGARAILTAPIEEAAR